MATGDDGKSALHWRDGQWHPFDVFEGESDVPGGIEQLGWRGWMPLGNSNVYCGINTWERSDGYLVEIGDPIHTSPYLKVDTLPELMDLLARWAPVVQAANLCGLVEDAESPSVAHDGVIEQMGKKVAYGARRNSDPPEQGV